MPPSARDGKQLAVEQFGAYRLLQRIGDGGMGVVYRAEMDGADGPRKVVIKRIRPELAREPSFVRMLAQEARLCALMHHPNIVGLVESGRLGEELFLAMDFVDGYDAAQLMNRSVLIARPIPIGVVCYIAHAVAEALAYVHTLCDRDGHPLGIVHRDVSPSNIMVTTDGGVKVLDFGIAKASAHALDDRTRTGTVKGKIAYFSPEQADGHPLDARSDLFSLGVVLMELLIQRRLFRGSSDFETLRRVREAELPPLRTLRDDLPLEIVAILEKLLARDRAARFQSARELADALAGPMRQLGGDAASVRMLLDELAPIDRGWSAGTPVSEPSPPPLDVVTAQVAIRPQPLRDPARRPGSSRWRAYLEQLPDGVDSFPACTMKASVLRTFYSFFGSPPLPSDMPGPTLALLRTPPLVSSFIPAAHVRLIGLALADVLGLDDDGFIARTHEMNVALLSGPLYRILFAVISTERLLKNARSRWETFHRGVTIDVVSQDRDRCRVALVGPAELDNHLTARIHATGIQAALEGVGARDVHTVISTGVPGTMLMDLSWSR